MVAQPEPVMTASAVCMQRGSGLALTMPVAGKRDPFQRDGRNPCRAGSTEPHCRRYPLRCPRVRRGAHNGNSRTGRDSVQQGKGVDYTDGLDHTARAHISLLTVPVEMTFDNRKPARSSSLLKSCRVRSLPPVMTDIFRSSRPARACGCVQDHLNHVETAARWHGPPGSAQDASCVVVRPVVQHPGQNHRVRLRRPFLEEISCNESARPPTSRGHTKRSPTSGRSNTVAFHARVRP